jgi:hypothetical protein
VEGKIEVCSEDTVNVRRGGRKYSNRFLLCVCKWNMVEVGLHISVESGFDNK